MAKGFVTASTEDGIRQVRVFERGTQFAITFGYRCETLITITHLPTGLKIPGTIGDATNPASVHLLLVTLRRLEQMAPFDMQSVDPAALKRVRDDARAEVVS